MTSKSRTVFRGNTLLGLGRSKVVAQIVPAEVLICPLRPAIPASESSGDTKQRSGSGLVRASSEHATASSLSGHAGWRFFAFGLDVEKPTVEVHGTPTH